MEEEEEEESNSLSHKNNLLNVVRRVIIQSNNKEYDNINLMNGYLESLHDKVLPKCQCCSN